MTVHSVQPCFYNFLLLQVGKCSFEITQLGYLSTKKIERKFQFSNEYNSQTSEEGQTN